MLSTRSERKEHIAFEMKKTSALPFAAFICAIHIVLALPAYCRNASNQPPALSAAGIRPYQAAPEPFWTEHGRLTLGFQLGFALENNIPHDISHINMVIAQPQIGIIAWDSPHSRLPFERFELISEGILGNSPHPGGRLFGTSLLLRLGFKPVGRMLPYLDAGSGPVHITIDANAPEIAGHTQFLSQGGVGLQYFFKPQRALVLEYRYFHMSNAGLQEPNHGFNGSMVTLGFCWLRRPRPLTMGALHHSRFHFPHLW